MPKLPFYVVIATAERENLLARTLGSLSSCQIPPGYRETIVVENGTRGKTEGVVARFDPQLGIRYLYVEEANKSVALNTALSTLSEGLIFFTDDDVRVHPGALCAYADAAGHEEAGFYYGGPTGVDYEEPPAVWLKSYLPASAKGLEYTEEDLHDDSWRLFLGFNWAAFAGDLRAAGGFDPNFGPGASFGSLGDENDMQRRLWASGVRQIYVPESRVWHYVPKERCSPRWVLRRAYQGGIQQGLRAEPQVLDLLGWPRWMVQVWLGKALKAARFSVSGDRRERFAAYHALCQYTGVVRAVRLVSATSDSSTNRTANG